MIALLAAILIPLFASAPTPGGCSKYALIRDTGAGWAHAAHWGPGLTVKTPHALPDTVWASQSSARLSWAAYRLGCVCAGDTTWTPALLVADASAWPDTNAFIEAGLGMRPVRTPGRFALSANEAGARLVHQETVQRRLSRRISELFGYWIGPRGERYADGGID